MEFCPKCGTKLQPNWKFCAICGYDFLQEKSLESASDRTKPLYMIEKPDRKQKFTLDENGLNNIRIFSYSLGKLFGQIGGYTIIQIIASVVLAFISVGMVFSMMYETSIPAIFDVFQTSIWTIIISSIILEIIMYLFLIKLINLLMGAQKQKIPFQDNYRKSALFFILGIISGIILLVVAIFLTNWILQLIWGILNDPSFEIEDLNQIPPTDIISTLMQVGRIGLSLAGFYYLKQNFIQLSYYMHNGEKVQKGLNLLVIGYLLMIGGSLLGLLIDLASMLNLAGLIITIVGFFKAADGLKNTIWSNRE